MELVGTACFVLAAVVAWGTWSQVLRVRAAASKDKTAARVLRRAKVRELIRRAECSACSTRFPMEFGTAYGKREDGTSLFLCPDCKALFERRPK